MRNSSRQQNEIEITSRASDRMEHLLYEIPNVDEEKQLMDAYDAQESYILCKPLAASVYIEALAGIHTKTC